MAIYIVTGKLGGGKTLACVSRIDAALAKGLRVATNLDLNISALPSCSRRSKNVDVLRVPDRPTVSDIDAIGFGIKGVNSLADARKSYDESRFGLLVLDECGTWLNSRDWQAEGRRDLINLLLHIRKHLWDVYLIIQDIALLDKQARKALAEHVVYCRRTDRMSVPIFSTLYRWFGGGRMPVPRLHVAHVKYGDQPSSLTVDKWWYRGEQLFDAYDTTQVFVEDYPHGVFNVLPPWYIYYKTFVNWTWRKRMRLTKIYMRQYSLIWIAGCSLLAGVVSASLFIPDPPPPVPVVEEQAVDDSPVLAGNFGLGASSQREIDPRPFVNRLRIHSYADVTGYRRSVTFTDGSFTYSDEDLAAMGITVRLAGRCHYLLIDADSNKKRLRCND